MDTARLLISCPDRPGIVATVAGFLAERGANIVALDQHSTGGSGGGSEFFMRLEFDPQGGEVDEAAFEPIAEQFGMDWRIAHSGHRKRVAVLVSRYDHCLVDLLWRWRRGELLGDIELVLSNHPDLASATRPTAHGSRVRARPCHRGDQGRRGTADARAACGPLRPGRAGALHAGPVAGFLEQVGCPVINIHHSFLPAFAGAEPYQRAPDRGVKLIGATAHYVTPDLDEGPIIEQDVQRVHHGHDVLALTRIGENVERTVLARAVQWHLDDRVLVHGPRTVVFA